MKISIINKNILLDSRGASRININDTFNIDVLRGFVIGTYGIATDETVAFSIVEGYADNYVIRIESTNRTPNISLNVIIVIAEFKG